MKFKVIALAGFMFYSLSSPAEEEFDCSKATNNLEFTYCADLQAKNEDKRLNDLYQKLKAVAHKHNATIDGKLANPNEKTLMEQSLVKAQVQWIKFRDTNCDYYYDTVYPGSAAANTKASCETKMTKARADELEEQLEYWNSL